MCDWLWLCLTGCGCVSQCASQCASQCVSDWCGCRFPNKGECARKFVIPKAHKRGISAIAYSARDGALWTASYCSDIKVRVLSVDCLVLLRHRGMPHLCVWMGVWLTGWGGAGVANACHRLRSERRGRRTAGAPHCTTHCTTCIICSHTAAPPHTAATLQPHCTTTTHCSHHSLHHLHHLQPHCATTTHCSHHSLHHHSLRHHHSLPHLHPHCTHCIHIELIHWLASHTQQWIAITSLSLMVLNTSWQLSLTLMVIVAHSS